MKNSDDMAFDKWLSNIYDESVQFRDWQSCDNISDNKENFKKAWQAAIAFERKRSEKLVEALERIDGNFEDHREVAHQALKEYKENL